MCKSVIFDARLNDEILLKITKGKEYPWGFLKFKQLDTDYTIEFNHITYSVSNGGIVLDPEKKTIIWYIKAGDFPSGYHEGLFVSQSVVAGLHLNVKIKIECYEDRV